MIKSLVRFLGLFWGGILLLLGGLGHAEDCRLATEKENPQFQCAGHQLSILSDSGSELSVMVQLEDRIRFRLTFEKASPSSYQLNDLTVLSRGPAIPKRGDKQFFQKIPPQFLPEVVADFLRFLPVGESLKELEQGLAMSRLAAPGERFFRSGGASEKGRICHMQGKKRVARFTGRGESYSRVFLVGRKPNCWGRCGRRCGRKVYTQGCLNHDACARHFQRNYGPCLDEFLKAAPGTVANNLWACN